MLLDNQQHGTYKERASKTSLYYSEAALNSALGALKTDTSWLTTPFTTAADMTEMGTNYSSITGSPTVTYLVYDNQTPVNYSVNWDQNGDGMVWVQATTTYQGRTTRVRELVSTAYTVSCLPYSAAWADKNVTLSGTSNIYAVNNDGTPDNSGAPYATTIMVGGTFTGTGSTNLASPGYTTQSVGLDTNGKVSGMASTVTHTTGGVGLLSDYFNTADQFYVMQEGQSGTPWGGDTAAPTITPTPKPTPTPTPTNTSTALPSPLPTYITATPSPTPTAYTSSSDLQMNANLTLTNTTSTVVTYNFKNPVRERQPRAVGQRGAQHHGPLRGRQLHRQRRHCGRHRPVRAPLRGRLHQLEGRQHFHRPPRHDRDHRQRKQRSTGPDMVQGHLADADPTNLAGGDSNNESYTQQRYLLPQYRQRVGERELRHTVARDRLLGALLGQVLHRDVPPAGHV